MKTIWMVLMLALMFNPGHSQQVKDFFYADGKELPVFVRGELSKGVILLYVQGGGGETAVDFARADYPRWKHSLELETAIAYYDQRGLNVRLDKIDSNQVSFEQYGDDIFKIAEELNRKYDAGIILLGHSLGGHIILQALSRFNEVPSPIKGAILMNTPITTDYSEERYKHYRPMYLRNLAYEFIQQNENVDYWKEALEWMNSTDSIYSAETSRKWNAYVDAAFDPAERKITPGMVSRVIFSRPYNPVRYLYKKDNKRVGDLLWQAEAEADYFSMCDIIQLPVLMITGRYDDIAPPEELQDGVKRLENGQLLIIDAAAHELFLDQPEELQRSVLGFVNEINDSR